MRCSTPLVALLALLLVSFDAQAKECRTDVTRGKELKQLIQNAHVLVALQSNDDEDEDQGNQHGPSKELCERFASTPDARVSDLEIVLVADDNTILQRKVWESSRPAPATPLQRLLYAIQQYLPSGAAKFLTPASPILEEIPHVVTHVLFTQGSSYDDGQGIQFPLDTTSADDVSTYLGYWLQRQKIGNYVYSLGVYDVFAAHTMKLVEQYGNTNWIPKLWVHAVGRLTQYLVQPAGMPFEKELAQLYVKCALKVLKEGPLVASNQVTRLERLLTGDGSSQDSSSSKLSPLQREQSSQRLHVWKKFAQPLEVEPNDVWKLVGRLVLNLASVLGVAILIPLVLMGGTEEEEEEESEENKAEEPVEEKPVEMTDDAVAPTTTTALKSSSPEKVSSTTTATAAAPATEEKPLSQKEKIAAARERARLSMVADKKRVEQVKLKKAQEQNQSNAAGMSFAEQISQSIPGGVVTEQSLNILTVPDLKNLLRERNLRVSGKKSELIDRVLEHMTK